MTNKELVGLCRKWQGVLRLSDWEVEIKFARHYDMEEKQGLCETILTKKLATIKILDPEDYSPAWMRPQNVEKTVIHELLHLHLMPIDTFPDGSLQHMAIEQAIECIADALVHRHSG